MSSKLLIIDGHSQLFRAFHAYQETAFAVNGQATNAIFGFFRILCAQIRAEKPTHIAVAFDVSKHSFRKEQYPEYKEGRRATPPSLPVQLEIIKKLLAAMDFPTFELEGYEADDLIATLATKGAGAGMEVAILSGDRDALQLIDDHTVVLYPGPKGVLRMDATVVEEKYGLPPAQYPELAALVGEKADNLPGVPGVGQKTALKWLKTYGNLEGILAHADEITGKVGESLREHVENVRRNRQLNVLVRDVALDCEVTGLHPADIDVQTIEAVCNEFALAQTKVEIQDVLEKIFGLGYRISGDAEAYEAKPIVTGNLTEWLAKQETDSPIALYVEGDYTAPGAVGADSGRQGQSRSEIGWLALAGAEDTFMLYPRDLEAEAETQLVQFLSTDPQLIGYEGKNLAHTFADRGWSLPQLNPDVRLCAYLVDPELKAGKRTDSPGKLREEMIVLLAATYLNRSLEGEATETGSDEALFSLDELAAITVEPQAPAKIADLAQAVRDLAPVLLAELDKREVRDVLTRIEAPVQAVLYQMERTGIAADLEGLRQLSDEFGARVESARQDAYRAIGKEINLSSPKQLQVVLFDELHMPHTRKTKRGYTTDANALAHLYELTNHPFLEALLRHRDNIKLQQMVDSLITEVAADGRIHTTFHQSGTATGRLSSSNPNLQNIPARTETGIQIRDNLVVGEGFAELMSVDYSQIEMRIMAHLSEDQALIEAFNSGEDLHRTMAAIVFGVPVSEVTPMQRTRVKATSYGLAYGLSAFGLSRQLNCAVGEAEELRSKYFERFGGVSEYLHQVVERARQTGYTQTMLGRRRYFPGLHASERAIREMNERQALNAPIQGSAADIIKLAMVEVNRQLTAGKFKSRILLQVHDELVLEIFPGESEAVEALVREAMASPVKMAVPLAVAVGRGHSWKEAEHS